MPSLLPGTRLTGVENWIIPIEAQEERTGDLLRRARFALTKLLEPPAGCRRFRVFGVFAQEGLQLRSGLVAMAGRRQRLRQQELDFGRFSLRQSQSLLGMFPR